MGTLLLFVWGKYMRECRPYGITLTSHNQQSHILKSTIMPGNNNSGRPLNNPYNAFLNSEVGEEWKGVSSSDPEYVRAYNVWYRKKYILTKEQKERYALRRAEKKAAHYATYVKNPKNTFRKMPIEETFQFTFPPKVCDCGGEYNSRARWKIHSKTKKHMNWIDKEFGHLPPPPPALLRAKKFIVVKKK